MDPYIDFYSCPQYYSWPDHYYLQQPCGPTTYTDSSNLVASTSQFVASSFIEGQPQALSSYHQDVSLPLHGASSSPAAIARRNLPTELFPGDSKEERERRCLLKELTDCKWFVDNEHEPPYAFRPFVNEMSTNDYRCTVVKCGKRLNRLDRAQDHFRKHINHRPHPCHGKCGFLSCSQRFYTRETLKAHTRKGTNRVVCSICDQEVDTKNLRRHHDSTRCKSYRIGGAINTE